MRKRVKVSRRCARAIRWPGGGGGGAQSGCSFFYLVLNIETKLNFQAKKELNE